jgi:hypothetical protein
LRGRLHAHIPTPHLLNSNTVTKNSVAVEKNSITVALAGVVFCVLLAFTLSSCDLFGLLDSTPSAEVTALTGTPGDRSAALTWTNPDLELLAKQLAADINAKNPGRATVEGSTVKLTGGFGFPLTVPAGVTLVGLADNTDSLVVVRSGVTGRTGTGLTNN